MVMRNRITYIFFLQIKKKKILQQNKCQKYKRVIYFLGENSKALFRNLFDNY